MGVNHMPLLLHPRVRQGLCRLAAIPAVDILAATGASTAVHTIDLAQRAPGSRTATSRVLD